MLRMSDGEATRIVKFHNKRHFEKLAVSLFHYSFLFWGIYVGIVVVVVLTMQSVKEMKMISMKSYQVYLLHRLRR